MASEHDLDLASADAVGRLVVRARRMADLSQRDLADRVGASRAAISRLESGAGLPSLPLLQQILTTAGLRLQVIDEKGEAVRPVPATSVRDNGGRRFPAHLDAAPPDEIPTWAIRGPRYDRPPARGWYRHREERDRLLAARPHAARQTDHPTCEELAERDRLRRGPQPVVRPAPMELACSCPDACYDDDQFIGSLRGCPCQCEPALP